MNPCASIAPTKPSCRVLDAMQLDAITATARHDSARAVELYKQIVAQSSETEKVFALVDLAALMKTTTTSKTRLKVTRRPAPKTPNMQRPTCGWGFSMASRLIFYASVASFDQAQSIYQALGNVEGRGGNVSARSAFQ